MSASLLHTDAWKAKVTELSTVAQATMDPKWHQRIQAATALCLHGGIDFAQNGESYVLSSDQQTWYTVNGACECQAWKYAQEPGYKCKHQIALRLALKAQELCSAPPTPEADEPWPTTPEELPHVQPSPCQSETPQTPGAAQGLAGPLPEAPQVSAQVPPQHVVLIQGRPFVKFAGLLQMAHERGLMHLQETWTYNDSELSLAHAVAQFQDGRHFEGSGDATPQNVNRKVVPHFRRVALTRAKSRALRDALNVDMVAVEELGDE